MRARAAAAVALAVLLGCGESETSRTVARPDTAPKPASAAASEAPGVRIRRQPDGTLRVRAHRAARPDVLAELAQVAGFTVAAGPTPPGGPIDLELARASAEDVLAAILADIPHHLEYAPARGGAKLVRVTIGAAPRPAPPPSATVSSAERDSNAPDPRAESLDPRDDETARDDGERLEGTPDELIAAVAGAPDPATRAAAARALGDIEGGEEAFRAAQALRTALADRDPQVLAAAITALEGLHDVIPDPAHVAAVRRLRDHADPRVRAAAASFLQWTEDDDPMGSHGTQDDER